MLTYGSCPTPKPALTPKVRVSLRLATFIPKEITITLNNGREIYG